MSIPREGLGFLLNGRGGESSRQLATTKTQDSQLSAKETDGDLTLNISDLQNDDEEEFIPPENLAMVCKGVYRSALPKKKNFPYLKLMGLKSILTLFQVSTYLQ